MDDTVVVVGGGITGLSAAHRLVHLLPRTQVEVWEASSRLGGKIATSPFAGLPAVDEGADAYLTRVPAATNLVRELGLGHHLVHPEAGRAAVWHGRMHTIPDGLLLGVPTGVFPLLRSGLLSRRGAMRAALEPVLPRSSPDHDSIGRWVRSRFGHEVHERLLDPLVGSIYAADTDRFSLAMVPQLAALSASRSALLGARAARKQAAVRAAGPVFEAPVNGMEALVTALTAAFVAHGGVIHTDLPVQQLEASVPGVLIDGRLVRGVILACPARAAARTLGTLSAGASHLLAKVEAASVVMVTASVPAGSIAAATQLSGYLVTKPTQARVTAVSFGSHKWAGWRPDNGAEVLRISLGRDGAPVDDLLHEHDDDHVANLALAEVGRHLGTTLTPHEVRVSRWPDAFPQYRPGHLQRLAEVERHLAVDAPGVLLAGASYRGMGIPACIQQGEASAAAMAGFLTPVRD